jgi:Mrp family chromosome partitioning ATPase
MSENKASISAFEAALDKVARPLFGGSGAGGVTEAPSPFQAGGFDFGESATEPPLTDESEDNQGPRRRASDMPVDDFSRFPVSDADFVRFEERFGLGPEQKPDFDNAFRIVRTTVLQGIKERGGQIIGVTSPTARNGKTVTSIHLARACARRTEQTVVLADLNLQRPLLAGYLDAREFRSGIGFFRGEGRAEDYLTRDPDSNLLFFLSDRATAQSAELLASPRFKQAMESFRGIGSNTVVILNLPPMLGSDDVMTVMPQLDGVVLVSEAGNTTFGELEEAAKAIPQDKILCAVLNKSRGVAFNASAD